MRREKHRESGTPKTVRNSQIWRVSSRWIAPEDDFISFSRHHEDSTARRASRCCENGLCSVNWCTQRCGVCSGSRSCVRSPQMLIVCLCCPACSMDHSGATQACPPGRGKWSHSSHRRCVRAKVCPSITNVSSWLTYSYLHQRSVACKERALAKERSGHLQTAMTHAGDDLETGEAILAPMARAIPLPFAAASMPFFFSYVTLVVAHFRRAPALSCYSHAEAFKAFAATVCWRRA